MISPIRVLLRVVVRVPAILLMTSLLTSAAAFAQTPHLSGTVRDGTGAPLPGVVVELRAGGTVRVTHSDGDRGEYWFDGVTAGPLDLSFTLANFANLRRSLLVTDADLNKSGGLTVDAVMHLVLSADITVTGKTTFTNLADAPAPPQDLVGIAQAASQGAITARQLETRPLLRPGEVLEAVPGVVISQHSGEGKANQYYLRGFNLDHGTDFATTVAGMPVNMPTHGHGHGYSDLNFLIPELASGVQFSKGPYFAEHGDFATAGTANINYTNTLDRPIVRVGRRSGRLRPRPAGRGAVGRRRHAAWRARSRAQRRPVGTPGRTAARSTGPSLQPRRQPQRPLGDADGLPVDWNATDQIPARAVEDGRIGRFGLVDPTDGGESSRYSASFEWQRTNGNASTQAHGLRPQL